MSVVGSKVLNLPAWPTPYPLSTAASHPVYHIFPNQSQTKHSHISYVLFPLPPSSPNTLSPAHLNITSSHWFLLCKLPTHHTSPPHFCFITETSFSFSVPDCNKPTHLHYRHPPKEFRQEQNLLSDKELDNEIYEPPNSWNGQESIFWAPTSYPKPQVGQMSTLTAQGQTRQYQEKLITGLQSKAKESTKFWGQFWFLSWYEGPCFTSAESKSDIHCLFHAVVSSLVCKQKLKVYMQEAGRFLKGVWLWFPKSTVSTSHTNNAFSSETDFGNPWCMEVCCTARVSLEVLMEEVAASKAVLGGKAAAAIKG